MNPTIYVNTILVGLVGLVGFAIAGTIINALGHRNLLSEYYVAYLLGHTCPATKLILPQSTRFVRSSVAVFSSGLMATAVGLFNQATTQTQLVAMFSIFITLGSISGTSMIGMSVTLVPTQLR